MEPVTEAVYSVSTHIRGDKMSAPESCRTIIALLLTLAACGPSIDLDAERAALRATDEAWAAAAAAGEDAELIASYWSDDASVFPADGPVVNGKEAILGFLGASLAIPGFSVSWQPDVVEVAPGGDFGYTTGTNEFTMPDSTGTMVTIRGRYATVWRKDAAGDWKCVIDMWNSGPPETS
jgi:ketosteroid isomerase-like protein